LPFATPGRVYSGIQIPKNQKPQLLKSGFVDRRHPAPVVVERLVIAPAVIDAAPALVGRRWPPGRVVISRPLATWATRSTLAAGRGSLIAPSGRGPLVVSTLTALTARPLAVAELGTVGGPVGRLRRRYRGSRPIAPIANAIAEPQVNCLKFMISRLSRLVKASCFTATAAGYEAKLCVSFACLGVRYAPRVPVNRQDQMRVSPRSRHARHAVTSQSFS